MVAATIWKNKFKYKGFEFQLGQHKTYHWATWAVLASLEVDGRRAEHLFFVNKGISLHIWRHYFKEAIIKMEQFKRRNTKCMKKK